MLANYLQWLLRGSKYQHRRIHDVLSCDFVGNLSAPTVNPFVHNDVFLWGSWYSNLTSNRIRMLDCMSHDTSIILPLYSHLYWLISNVLIVMSHEISWYIWGDITNIPEHSSIFHQMFTSLPLCRSIFPSYSHFILMISPWCSDDIPDIYIYILIGFDLSSV